MATLSRVSITQTLGAKYSPSPHLISLIASGASVKTILSWCNTSNIDEKRTPEGVLSPDGITPLYCAIKCNREDVALALLERGASSSETSGVDQCAPLHLVCYLGLEALAEELLQRGALVNQPTKAGLSPLMYVLMSKKEKPDHLRIAKTLLRWGADVKATDGQGYHAIHHACRHPNEAILSLLDHHCSGLLNTVTPDGQTCMLLAVGTNLLDHVRYLLERDVDVNAVTFTSDEILLRSDNNPVGISALHRACQLGYADMVSLLLDHGAEIHKQNLKQIPFIPLHEACQFGHLDVVRILVDRGADIERVTDDLSNDETNQISPLCIAALQGHLNVVEYLLQQKADPNGVSGAGRATPLHTLCNPNLRTEKGNLNRGAMIKLLVRGGADVEQLSRQKATPLFLAIKYRDFESARTLLLLGADPNSINLEQQITPLHRAIQNQDLKITSLLYNHRANLNQTSGGFTLLAIAYARAQQLPHISLAPPLSLPCRIDCVPNPATTQNPIIQFLIRHGARLILHCELDENGSCTAQPN